MHDLFTSPLDQVRYEDVDAYLGIEAVPLDQRPREGDRLDFKQDIPSDLGKYVTAFANRAGGLIILGVKEENGIPVGYTPLGPSRSDYATRLTSIIDTTVEPRPEYSIAVVSTPTASDCCLAVLRVEAGPFPPYYYLRDRTIVIRTGDRCDRASLSEIEALFKRREDLNASAAAALRGRPDLFAVQPGADRDGRAPIHLTVWAHPYALSKVSLDSRSEAALTRLLEHLTTLPLQLIARHGDYFVLEHRARGLRTRFAHQAWCITRHGSIGFAANLEHADPEGGDSPVVYLADLARSLVTFTRFVQRALESVNLVAPCQFEILIALERATLIDDGVGTGALIGGDPLDPTALRGSASLGRRWSFTEVSAPIPALTEIVMWCLRTLRGLDINSAVLASRLQVLWERSGRQ